MTKQITGVWILVSLGALGVLGVLALCIVINLVSTPKVTIPPPPAPPSPNAYDYYIAAGITIRDVNNIGFFPNPAGNTSPPPASSAKARIYTLEEKRALIAGNATALAKTREGLKHECLCPRPSGVGIIRITGIRDTARLLSLEGDIKAAEGNWAGAMNSYMDAIKLGEDITHGGNVITSLLGAAIQTIGRRPAWKAVDHLNAKQAQTAVKRIENITSNHVQFSEVLTEEKWSQVDMSACLTSPPSTKAGWSARKRMYIMSQYMDQVIANAKLPYAVKTPAPKAPGVMQNILSLGGGTLIQMMGTLYTDKKVQFTYIYMSETQNALLTIALALRAYKLDNSQYPAKLTDLAPKYLKKLPDDPFAMKGTFQYRLSGSKYILYSIGPDGKDDGGGAVIDPSLPKDRQYKVDDKSKGDIVAGVNI